MILNVNDREIITQIMDAYRNGTLDWANVPAFQAIIRQEIRKALTDSHFQAQQQTQLKNDHTWYHLEIERTIEKTAEQVNTEQIKQTVEKDIAEQQHKLSLQLLNNMNMQAKLEKQQKLWIPVLLTVLPTMAFLLISFCAIWFIFIR